MGQTVIAVRYYEQTIDIIETIRIGITSEAGRAGYFATVVDIYANAILLQIELGHYSQAFDFVERARSRAFLDLLAANSSDFSDQLEIQTIKLETIQKRLTPDCLVLEYFTTGLLEVRDKPSSNPKRYRFPPSRIFIFAITRTQIRVHEMGSPNHLRPGRLNNVVERHFLHPRTRRTLYDQLLGPVEDLLQDKRRLYLIPHGPLHYIPFQALIAPDGDTLLREAGPQLLYAPSATLLCRPKQGNPLLPSNTCLALGYNGTGTSQLHFAEEEAHRVARLTGGEAIVGDSPKKMRLYQEAAEYRLLHLSCHGDFNPEAPLASALHLAPDETLTALDIFDHLRLRCDLVILSACESGLNRVRRGDELIGLTRAFKYAGASALIATLWRVDEHSTLIVMERFYQEVQNGLDFAEALKRAQLHLKNLIQAEEASNAIESQDRSTPEVILRGQEAGQKIFADPFYWAPFIFIGSIKPEITGET